MPWPMHRRVERQAIRLHQMMERLDVDPCALARLGHGEAYAQARATCLFCGTSDRCLRWLDGAEGRGKPPDFCPNLRVLEGCARRSACA